MDRGPKWYSGFSSKNRHELPHVSPEIELTVQTQCLPLPRRRKSLIEQMNAELRRQTNRSQLEMDSMFDHLYEGLEALYDDLDSCHLLLNTQKFYNTNLRLAFPLLARRVWPRHSLRDSLPKPLLLALHHIMTHYEPTINTPAADRTGAQIMNMIDAFAHTQLFATDIRTDSRSAATIDIILLYYACGLPLAPPSDLEDNTAMSNQTAFVIGAVLMSLAKSVPSWWHEATLPKEAGLELIYWICVRNIDAQHATESGQEPILPDCSHISSLVSNLGPNLEPGAKLYSSLAESGDILSSLMRWSSSPLPSVGLPHDLFESTLNRINCWYDEHDLKPSHNLQILYYTMRFYLFRLMLVGPVELQLTAPAAQEITHSATAIASLSCDHMRSLTVEFMTNRWAFSHSATAAAIWLATVAKNTQVSEMHSYCSASAVSILQEMQTTTRNKYYWRNSQHIEMLRAILSASNLQDTVPNEPGTQSPASLEELSPLTTTTTTTSTATTATATTATLPAGIPPLASSSTPAQGQTKPPVGRKRRQRSRKGSLRLLFLDPTSLQSRRRQRICAPPL